MYIYIYITYPMILNSYLPVELMVVGSHDSGVLRPHINMTCGVCVFLGKGKSTNQKLGDSSKYFLFSPLFGEMIQID